MIVLDRSLSRLSVDYQTGLYGGLMHFELFSKYSKEQIVHYDLTIGKTQRLKKGLKIEKWNFEGDVFVFTTTDRQSGSGSLQV